ncbi:MAG: hypothetical protein ACR2OV_08315, partial [Hyphomicrobiaceae bacterium]
IDKNPLLTPFLHFGIFCFSNVDKMVLQSCSTYSQQRYHCIDDLLPGPNSLICKLARPNTRPQVSAIVYGSSSLATQ